MPEVIVEKEVCDRCGVDVREDTLFCYNCGNRVAETPGSGTSVDKNGEIGAGVETRAALDGLAAKLSARGHTGDKLARAAEQRRKARVSQSRQRKIVWEPTGDSSHGIVLLFAIFVAIITFVVVLLTVVWK